MFRLKPYLGQIITIVILIVICQKLFAQKSRPIHVWVSTADAKKKLSKETDLYFNANRSNNVNYTINVNSSIKFQQWIGCGACTNDGSSWLMCKKLNKASKDKLMSQLFSKKAGIGMDWIRQQMGSGDAAVINNGWWTYDDMPKGGTDTLLEHFSIDMEKDYILPILKQALQINPNLKIIGCPWTPPGWMKTSANDANPLTHGDIQPKYYGHFANYFIRFIQEYAKENIPIYGISLQNEPLANSQKWQACGIPANIEAQLIKDYFVPAFARHQIKSKLFVFDHNWDNDGWDYVNTIYKDTSVYNAVAGSMWHHYVGTPDVMTKVHNAYPNKEIWFTEGCATTNWHNPIYLDYNTYRNSFLNFSYNMVAVPRNWCQTMMMYQIAMDPNHGPAVFAPPTNYGMVTIDPNNGSIAYRPEYYTLGHISKFVSPGAYRIDTNQYEGDMESVAFKNADGSIVLVLSNRKGSAKTVNIKWRHQNLNYKVPAESMVTLIWQ